MGPVAGSVQGGGGEEEREGDDGVLDDEEEEEGGDGERGGVASDEADGMQAVAVEVRQRAPGAGHGQGPVHR